MVKNEKKIAEKLFLGFLMIFNNKCTLNIDNEEENVDYEWARLMAMKPPALESVKVKPEMKVENVDVSMASSEVSPTLELDF